MQTWCIASFLEFQVSFLDTAVQVAAWKWFFQLIIVSVWLYWSNKIHFWGFLGSCLFLVSFFILFFLYHTNPVVVSSLSSMHCDFLRFYQIIYSKLLAILILIVTNKMTWNNFYSWFTQLFCCHFCTQSLYPHQAPGSVLPVKRFRTVLLPFFTYKFCISLQIFEHVLQELMPRCIFIYFMIMLTRKYTEIPRKINRSKVDRLCGT